MATLVLADMSLEEIERTFGANAAAGINQSRNVPRPRVRTRRSAPNRLTQRTHARAQELASGQDV